MKSLYSVLAIVLATVIFTSCQKEVSDEFRTDPNTQASLIGEWKFLGMETNSISTMSYTESGTTYKDVTVSAYKTKDNAGTTTFSSSTYQTTNIAYSVDTIVKGFFYENGVLIDSIEMPFQFALPPFSGSQSYQVVGSDSIYFSNGGVSSPGSTPAPGGCKFRIEGNKLILTTNISSSETIDVGGGTMANKVITGKATATYQKQ